MGMEYTKDAILVMLIHEKYTHIVSKETIDEIYKEGKREARIEMIIKPAIKRFGVLSEKIENKIRKLDTGALIIIEDKFLDYEDLKAFETLVQVMGGWKY